MFGKGANAAMRGTVAELLFQSPCAGNMFGKLPQRLTGLPGPVPGVAFQSPCAGNMFGKFQWVEVRVTGKNVYHFQSPCAGNMFGKYP